MSTAATDWLARIRERLQGSAPRHAAEDWVLPGLTTEQSRHYRPYFPAEPVPAAVLVSVIARPEPTVLLTQRAADLRHHAGQVSFAGGRIEPEDADPAAAALREAHEEIGLPGEFVSVVGYLPDHIMPSGYRVTPVVGLVRPGFELAPDPAEVADTFEVPLAYLFDPANRRPRRRRYGPDEAEVELCDIVWGERIIWGATAGMLVALQRLCV